MSYNTASPAQLDDDRCNLRAALCGAGFAQSATVVSESGYLSSVHKLTRGGLHVFVYPDDGGRVEAHCFDQRGCNLWSMRFDGSVPDAVVQAAVTAA